MRDHRRLERRPFARGDPQGQRTLHRGERFDDALTDEHVALLAVRRDQIGDRVQHHRDVVPLGRKVRPVHVGRRRPYQHSPLPERRRHQGRCVIAVPQNHLGPTGVEFDGEVMLDAGEEESAGGVGRELGHDGVNLAIQFEFRRPGRGRGEVDGPADLPRHKPRAARVTVAVVVVGADQIAQENEQPAARGSEPLELIPLLRRQLSDVAQHDHVVGRERFAFQLGFGDDLRRNEIRRARSTFHRRRRATQSGGLIRC